MSTFFFGNIFGKITFLFTDFTRINRIESFYKTLTPSMID